MTSSAPSKRRAEYKSKYFGLTEEEKKEKYQEQNTSYVRTFKPYKDLARMDLNTAVTNLFKIKVGREMTKEQEEKLNALFASFLASPIIVAPSHISVPAIHLSPPSFRRGRIIHKVHPLDGVQQNIMPSWGSMFPTIVENCVTLFVGIEKDGKFVPPDNYIVETQDPAIDRYYFLHDRREQKSGNYHIIEIVNDERAKETGKGGTLRWIQFRNANIEKGEYKIRIFYTYVESV